MKLLLQAVERRETLLGILNPARPLPREHPGNCVTVGRYHIRNICAENLRQWELETGSAEVQVEIVAPYVVEIVDERVPDHYLRDYRCRVCETRSILRGKYEH